MNNGEKSKAQLKNELNRLRGRIAELEARETKKSQTHSHASLLESKRQLLTLMDNLPGMVYRCLNDDNWTMEFISEGSYDLTGYAPADLIGNRTLSYNEIIHPDDRNDVWEQIQESLAERHPFRLVYRIQTVSGEQKWVWEQGVGIFSDQGDLLALEGFITDITKRTLAEEALRESVKRFRALLDVTPNPIVVFTKDHLISYLNPSFTRLFGWTKEELKGKQMPYGSSEIEIEAGESFRRLFEEGALVPYETKRMTKDGRILDVVTRGVTFKQSKNQPAGVLMIFRDITLENQMSRNKEMMQRISMALPEHPNLEELVDYVSSEVKRFLNCEGALVILLEEENQELLSFGASYDDMNTQKKVKGTRFQMDEIAAGKVIRNGKPLIVSDASKHPDLYPKRDQEFGYQTRNLLEVPLKTSDRTFGVLCAINKKEGPFDQADIELLNMISGTVALSIENARFSKDIKEAHQEVMGLNRTKDKVIEHLSHELKTPVSVISLSLNTLTRKLADLPTKNWTSVMERLQRNLDRIKEIQYEVEDIMRNRQYNIFYNTFSLILDQCSDELEALITDEGGDEKILERVRTSIDTIYGAKDLESTEIFLNEFVKQRLKFLSSSFSHRKISITCQTVSVPAICIPLYVLEKVMDGLIKNAVENTPDKGKIEVSVRKEGTVAALIIQDFGVGIIEEHKKRIFEGFFTTQDTMAYSSKQAFDFNAGGKGADLLRIKIFSERYNFKIDMHSSRCVYLPQAGDICPGNITECIAVEKPENCYRSGGTTFSIYFQPARSG